MITNTINGSLMRCDISVTIIHRGSKRPADITPQDWKIIGTAARQNKRPIDEMADEWRRVSSQPPAAPAEFLRPGLPPVGSDGTIIVHISRKISTDSVLSLLTKAEE